MPDDQPKDEGLSMLNIGMLYKNGKLLNTYISAVVRGSQSYDVVPCTQGIYDIRMHRKKKTFIVPLLFQKVNDMPYPIPGI